MPERPGRPRSRFGARRAAGAVLAAGSVVVAAAPVAALAAEATPSTRCQVTDPRLGELSGLVAVGEQMLAIPDGGDRLAVYLLDSACQVVDLRTAPVDPYDPEDLAVTADGTVWLADTGDNRGTRETVALLALRADGSTALYRLAYPDGAHDAEALLMAPDGTPYLVTKEVLGASAVYRPVSALVDGGTVGLTEVAGVEFVLTGSPGGPVGRAGQLMVTGGAVSPDGRFVALRTYTDAYVWPLTGSDVAGALAAEPVRVALPAAPQGEAISFSTDGGGLLVAGEGTPGDVTLVPLPTGAAQAADGEPADASDVEVPAVDHPVWLVSAAVVAGALAAGLIWLGGRLRRRD